MVTLLIIMISLTFAKSQAANNSDDIKLSKIVKGDNPQKPTLILLSGPTDNWHSDLAWWILGQNYLSQYYSTIAIDRASQGFSDTINKPSYRDFSSRLADFLLEQGKPLIIVAFASSNLSVQLALKDPLVQKKVKGVVLIDPDVLTKHAIQHYTGESENYRKNWLQLEEYIKAGKYQDRIAKKIMAERNHLAEIIPDDLSEFMDWDLYGQYEQLREKPQYQINKFKEVTTYKTDLESAIKHSLPKSIPVVILDSDFETGYLAAIKEKEIKSSIIKWRDQGKEQFFKVASKNSCSAYWPVNSQEHLLMFTRPELIQLAVERIETCRNTS